MTVVENLNDLASIAVKSGVVESDNEKSELIPISRLRQAIPQLYAVSAKNLLLITLGTTLGFPTILLPALQKEDAEISVTLEELTWLGSITLLLGPCGCLISGPISQVMGRKRPMLVANLPFIVTWVLLYFAETPALLFIPMALAGLTGGLIEGPVLIYVSEITQPHLRGPLCATASMAVIIGIFIQLLAGSLADWRTVALINIAFPVMCAVALFFVPESPYWLAGKGRMEEAAKSLCFLRGWVSPPHIEKELKTITLTVDQSADQKKNDKTNKIKFWEPYFRKSVVKPFFLLTVIFFADAFGGSCTLQTYAVSIFESMNAPIDKYSATVWLGVAEILGTLACVVSIHFTGKRKLTFFSIFGTGFCFGFSAVYSYLLSYETFDPEAWTWLPTTLLISAAFFSHAGIKLIAWILIGEVFHTTTRSGATGIAASTGYIFVSISIKIFLYMIDGMKISGTLFFYAAVNFVAGIILYYILPETEGRTLEEIEDHYAGINNLKNKPKVAALPFKEKWSACNPSVVTDDTERRW